MINLLMFDLDGTLFETANGIHKAVNALMAERREPPLSYELVSSFIGFGLHRLILQLDQATQHRLGDIQKLESDFHRHYRLIFLPESHLYEGVISFLETWPHKLAVVSNKDEFYVRELVSKSELKKFNWSHIIGGNTLRYKKPHPEPLYSAMQAAGVSANTTLMIGDGLPDIQSAQRAKVRSVAISFGYTTISELIQAGADCRLDSYKDLPKVIEYFC